ncbi:hypothetical protein [Fontivita pretiosa]|uniref:hypothetical protein n=1 Tax=Fontivita pretiosa TaxID=2989684 RepID=UPI003D16697F
MSELATYAPDVFPTFKTGGYGFEDFAAALQVTTQRLGRNEPTLRQLRSLPMRMLKAQDVLGFKFQSSSFGGRLGEIRSRLQGMGRDQQLSAISQIFEAEGAVVAATLLENLGQFQQSRQRVAGVGENFLMGRAIQRGADPAYSMAMLSRSAGILRENIGAELAQDPEALRKATLWELTRTGAELTLRKEQPWLTDEEIRRQAAGEMELYGARNRYAALSINKITDAALQSAGPDMASREALIWQNYMQRIQLGMVKDADTSAMNQQDAQELARAWQAGYRFSPESLAEYHRLQAADPTGRAAAGWMARQRRWAPARFDRVAEPDAGALPAGGDLVKGARKMAEAAQHFLTFAQANSGPAPAAPSQPTGPAGTP